MVDIIWYWIIVIASGAFGGVIALGSLIIVKALWKILKENDDT